MAGRKEYNKSEFDKLFNMAVEELKQIETSRRRQYPNNPILHMPCQVLYRHKPEEHFKKVDGNGGKEHKNIKDCNGDPANCINGQIKGLFFFANVDFKTNGPFWMGAFGDTQVSIPVSYFLQLNGKGRLYFADFYCTEITSTHWVTLVHTWRGSDPDRFCEKKLKELDISNNPFLWVDGGGYHVTACLMVEIFHTDNINHEDIQCQFQDYRRCTFKEFPPRQRKGDMPKDASCKICNIQPSVEELLGQLKIK